MLKQRLNQVCQVINALGGWSPILTYEHNFWSFSQFCNMRIGPDSESVQLETYYNAHFEVHSDISVITEQPYNESLIHRKYNQWEPCLYGVISKWAQ